MLKASALTKKLWTPGASYYEGDMPPSTDWTPVNLGSHDICDYYDLPGDNAYTIPDGDYYASRTVNSYHPNTAGKFKGYALFRPQTFRGVRVDLGYPGKVLPNGAVIPVGGGDMTFAGDNTSGAKNIISCGFVFQNGVINWAAYNIFDWYCEQKFPYSVWFSEPNYPNSYHGSNDCGFYNYGCVGIRRYGLYIHDVGSGPTFHNGCRYVYMVGFNIETVDNGGRYDAIHPDALPFLGGNVWNSFITDFEIRAIGRGTGVQNQNLSGSWNGGAGNWISADSSNNNFARGWVHDCSAAGFTIESFHKMDGTPTHNDGTLTDIHVWNNGTGSNGQSLASWQYKESVDTVDGTNYTMGAIPNPTRISYPTAGVCDTLIAQSGTPPHTAWQAVSGQRYGDVIAFMTALGWPQ